MQEDSMSADRATTAQLESVNGRLKKGEGWVGYRFSNNAEGRKIESKFLYYAFYVNGVQKFVNTKTNDAEDAYRQLLDARGQTQRGFTVLPSESGRITYQHFRDQYIADKPERDYPSNMSKLAHLDKFFGKMKVTSITTDVLRSYITHRRKHVANPTIRRELNILRAMFNLACGSVHYPGAIPESSQLPTRRHGTRVYEWWAEVGYESATVLHVFVCNGLPTRCGPINHMEKCQP